MPATFVAWPRSSAAGTVRARAASNSSRTTCASQRWPSPCAPLRPPPLLHSAPDPFVASTEDAFPPAAHLCARSANLCTPEHTTTIREPRSSSMPSPPDAAADRLAVAVESWLQISAGQPAAAGCARPRSRSGPAPWPGRQAKPSCLIARPLSRPHGGCAAVRRADTMLRADKLPRAAAESLREAARR